MTDIVIIDTDVLIDAGRNISEAVFCLEQIEDRFSAAISAVTQMELIIGCRNSGELRALEHFLERFEIIKLDEDISDKALGLLKQYRLSHGLLIADALIAATVMISEQQFVSKNQRDYRFIENLELLPYPNTFNATPADEE